MDQPPPFQQYPDVEGDWETIYSETTTTSESASSGSGNTSGGAPVLSDSLESSSTSDDEDEDEDEDDYTPVNFSAPTSTVDEALQLWYLVRGSLRKVGGVAKEVHALASQELLHGDQINAAGKVYYSEQIEDFVNQGKTQLGELRSALQIIQSSAIFADGQRAQNEVNDRNHDLVRAERAFARREFRLDQRIDVLRDDQETLRDDRETLEQQQNVLKADQARFQLDCEAFEAAAREMDEQRTKMDAQRTNLETDRAEPNRQTGLFAQQLEAHRKNRQFLQRTREELDRQETALATAKAANLEEERIFAAERARIALCHRSLAEATDQAMVAEQVIVDMRIALGRMRGAMADPGNGPVPQGANHFHPMVHVRVPGGFLVQPHKQSHVEVEHYHHHHQQQHGVQPRRDFGFIHPNQQHHPGVLQHGHFGFGHPQQHLQQNGVQERDFLFEHQGQQEMQFEPMQYDEHSGMLHQRAPFQDPDQWYAYNAPPRRHQRQHWPQPWEGNLQQQLPPNEFDDFLDAHEMDDVEHHDAIAQENDARLNEHDMGRMTPNGPFELDAQQNGFFPAPSPADQNGTNLQNQEFEAMDQGHNEPDQGDQSSEYSGSADDDASMETDEEGKENDYDWDGTFREDSGDDRDDYEDDVEPIDIDE